ncbi:hypothetical protein FGIG_05462 [Fasciola gigantica]|uniref:Uncharacterized protein n=1 Tax=Fasciola gigantica TaxID=46835 RepID=A0A504YRS9_FASGI|nr:hypothetical protein FGIG_05462 [Fasciola gigantica]
MSLNGKFVGGSNFTNGVFGGTRGVRNYPEASSADIKVVLLHVREPVLDRWTLSFSFRDSGNLDKLPEVYETNVHPSGSPSSFHCAIFEIRCRDSGHDRAFPAMMASAVRENFYIDDSLASVESVDDSFRLARELSGMLQKGIFCLANSASNFPEVSMHPQGSELSCVNISIITKVTDV